jgi:uncharacterized protein DUF4340
MKISRPIIYLIIAIIAGLVIISLENPWQSRVEDSDGVQLVGVKNFDTKDVGRVEISQLLSGATLIRDDQRWSVRATTTPLMKSVLKKEGRPIPEQLVWSADGSRLRSELGVFSGLYRGTLVSSNPEKRRLYQVDDESGLHLKLFDKGGKAMLDIIIGKSGPDFTSTYVRNAGSDEVYLVPRPLTGRFSSKASDWRNRKLWSVGAALVSGMDVSSSDGSYSIKRRGEEKVWDISVQDKKTGSLNEDGWLAFVGKFTTATATGFADDVDAAESGVDSPEIILTLHWKGGGGVTLNIGRANKLDQYYARVKGDDSTTYLLSGKSVESIPLKAPSPTGDKDEGKK